MCEEDAGLTAIREAGYRAWQLREEAMGWRKSRHSWANGNCAEVGADGWGVAVRDSKAPGRVLRFSLAAWQAFMNSIDWS